jgi:hypothetical protein
MSPDSDAYEGVLDAYIYWTRIGSEEHLNGGMSEDAENNLLDVLDALGDQLTPVDAVLGAIEGLAQAVFGNIETRQ